MPSKKSRGSGKNAVKITENPVENYLKQNCGLKLSATTISKRLGIRRKEVYFFIKNSDKLRRVNPMEVGSNAFLSRCFTFMGP